MKIELIQNLSGSKSYSIGEEFDTDIDISIEQAVRYVEKGIAKPKDKQEYLNIKAKLEAKAIADEELKARAIASIQQDKLKESVEYLKAELDSTLELIEDDEFKDKYSIEHIYQNLITDLSTCTKLADYKAVAKRYIEE